MVVLLISAAPSAHCQHAGVPAHHAPPMPMYVADVVASFALLCSNLIDLLVLLRTPTRTERSGATESSPLAYGPVASKLRGHLPPADTQPAPLAIGIP